MLSKSHPDILISEIGGVDMSITATELKANLSKYLSSVQVYSPDEFVPVISHQEE